jgi:hypothetical protein
MYAACVVFLILAVPTYGEPPAASPLHKQQLNMDNLKAWDTRTYSMTYRKPGGGPVEEQSVGRMKFVCESKSGLVRFTNVTRMYLPDGKRFIEYRGESLHPETNLFSTKEVRLHAGRSDGVTLQDSKATIEDGKLKIVTEEKGKSSTVDGRWPGSAIVDVAMFYIVTLVPREGGRRYLIENYVSSSALQRTKPQVLECEGLDQQAGSSEKPWTLFLLYEPENQAKAVRYWVSQDGLLRRVQLNPQNRIDLISDEEDKKDVGK